MMTCGNLCHPVHIDARISHLALHQRAARRRAGLHARHGDLLLPDVAPDQHLRGQMLQQHWQLDSPALHAWDAIAAAPRHLLNVHRPPQLVELVVAVRAQALRGSAPARTNSLTS